MFAKALAGRLQRKGIHYGWIIVTVAFFSSLCTAGAIGLPGAFILPFGKEFGWDPSQVSSALAIRLLLFGLMAPFSATLIARYGVRRMMLSAQTLVIVGLLGGLVMTSLWQLVIFWGIIIGVGTGMTALVLGTILSTRWFTARRGLVIGMLTAATATGQLSFLPLAAWLIEHVGWRYAILPSVAFIALAGIFTFLFMRDRPADVGLLPYGETNPEAVLQVLPASGNVIANAFVNLAMASRRLNFWLLSGTFFICGLSTAGLVQTHFIPFCVDQGMTAIEGASMLAFMGAFDFVGTILSGYLSDRFDNRKLLFWYYALRGLSLLWLPYSTFTIYGLSFFVIFYGLDWIATIPPTVNLTAQTFDREKAGLVFGWIYASHQIGSAAAALAGGLTRTAYATYLPAFIVAGAACLIAAVMTMMIVRPGTDTRRVPQPAPAQ
jgi:MFS family permease